MQLFQTLQSARLAADPVVIDPAELVSDQLLNELRGDVLLISSAQTIICRRTAGNLRQRALSWLNMVANRNSSRYIAGRISAKGGRFRIVTRDEALELIARWLFAELQNQES